MPFTSLGAIDVALEHERSIKENDSTKSKKEGMWRLIFKHVHMWPSMFSWSQETIVPRGWPGILPMIWPLSIWAKLHSTLAAVNRCVRWRWRSPCFGGFLCVMIRTKDCQDGFLFGGIGCWSIKITLRSTPPNFQVLPLNQEVFPEPIRHQGFWVRLPWPYVLPVPLLRWHLAIVSSCCVVPG